MKGVGCFPAADPSRQCHESFSFLNTAEKMRIDPVLSALSFHHEAEVDWSSLGVEITFFRMILTRVRYVITELRDSSR